MTGTVLEAIFAVFRAVGVWIVESIQLMVPMFYAEGSLTFLGALSIAGLAVSISFLLLGLIQRFMHFRG